MKACCAEKGRTGPPPGPYTHLVILEMRRLRPGRGVVHSHSSTWASISQLVPSSERTQSPLIWCGWGEATGPGVGAWWGEDHLAADPSPAWGERLGHTRPSLSRKAVSLDSYKKQPLRGWECVRFSEVVEAFPATHICPNRALVS